MTRKWKPGDVAIATVRGVAGVRVVRVNHRSTPPWMTLGDRPEGAIWHPDHRVEHSRPLVVIDPEDREQVERLLSSLMTSWQKAVVGLPIDDRDALNRVYLDALQAALREFADPKPPKPEEPTGWLSVIEDRGGVQWYRWSVRPKDFAGAWISVMDEGRCYPTGWSDIDAVKVLSEGIS